MNRPFLEESIRNDFKSILYLLLIISGIIILRNAWVGDDSCIGFRTSYNFVHGHGLTFNISERVQSFTNPLWVIIVGVLSLVTGEMYITSTLLSISLTLFMLYWASVKIAKDIFSVFLLFTNC